MRKTIFDIAAKSRMHGFMERSICMEFSGATYHVMCRGDRREEVLGEDGNRQMMLATVGMRGGGAILVAVLNDPGLQREQPAGRMLKRVVRNTL